MSVEKNIKVSVLGATGMVGQNCLRLLENHPWFQVVDVAASERSSGKTYKEAVGKKWYMDAEIPDTISNLIVRNVHDYGSIPDNVTCVFSALDLNEKQDTRDFEFGYAEKGFAVISTSSANRQTIDVPMIIPEINAKHADVIPIQQKNRNLPSSGFVAVKPNCSIQSYIVVLEALKQAGYLVDRVQVTTLQALSGAGYKALTNLDLKENVVPYIGGEEEKTEKEPLKIFGKITDDGIIQSTELNVNAVCTRVPVVDGHTAVVHLGFSNEAPSLDEFKSILSSFTAEPQSLKLPSSPNLPILVLDDVDRPQPKLDRDSGKGMAVTVGRIAIDTFFDIRFIGLSHNTVRGASGGAILVAELLIEKGFIS
ncbi:MAG: aspartate-semialdehyde dehydrogenase [Candidatus Marinimicrobia bacterium]|jgi:aspartate-semialdehyde dehydrogenase|nr:aspartate-semialdehyde dehydrogenase [Candidatus Neomarinimicrobiota bacterium]MBT3936541.1 aspartate-semialdehyde dehydrogenase [Candidatus Neomarinimicrobiota bacterium]MBT3961388.1 aspartate-semialdehyde dehydrogenase [Candidatus Neomarinimicrobiota bacterium]MBT4382752.1 aspartate-semialdehyde dehydrogenase [Candidatus Neomarinimicrobiota bacterium]MBT4636619.1 aspartate-semialdehyde dehydrogenase [Candidatus Neomarinimicrobiota bacterium]